ncbi:uncharacterized protein PHA67_006406 isoform 1-T1 [Liasis olivaceus]
MFHPEGKNSHVIQGAVLQPTLNSTSCIATHHSLSQLESVFTLNLGTACKGEFQQTDCHLSIMSPVNKSDWEQEPETISGETTWAEGVGMVPVVKACVLKILSNGLMDGPQDNGDQMDGSGEAEVIQRLCAMLSNPEAIWLIINTELDKMCFAQESFDQLDVLMECTEKNTDPLSVMAELKKTSPEN